MGLFEATNLYVVKPSIVVQDSNEQTVDYKRDSVKTVHIVQFIQPPINLSIANHKRGRMEDVFNSRPYYEHVGHICHEGDYYISLLKGDKTLLARYIWEMITGEEFTDNVNNYAKFLKSGWTSNELYNFISLARLKENEKSDSKPYEFVVKQKRKELNKPTLKNFVPYTDKD